MADEVKKVEEQELTDVELAELANKELRKRDEEIAKLKKELAVSKLYSKGTEEDETEPVKTREENYKILTDPNVYDYDRIEALCNLSDIQIAETGHSAFGENAEEVTKFLRDCLDACDGDKSKFISVYQSRISADPPEVAFAWNKRNKK